MSLATTRQRNVSLFSQNSDTSCVHVRIGDIGKANDRLQPSGFDEVAAATCTHQIMDEPRDADRSLSGVR
jgi:hypothetical protein